MYCPCGNNCEHFANKCKTGRKECHQICTLYEILVKSALSSIGSLANAAQKSRSMSFVIKKILSVCARLKELNVEKLTEEYGAKFVPKLAVLISVVTEIILLVRDFYIAITKFSEGRLTRKEYLEVITKRISAAVCSLSGFQLGYLLGGVIPLAFLGSWPLAALPLSVFGAIVVGAGGDYLAKLVGGYLGEIITPLVLYIDNSLSSMESTMDDLHND
jgi:hypothetical protein